MPNPIRIDPKTGEKRQWDGSQWTPMATAAASAGTAVPMYHPGLNDSPSDAQWGEAERTAGQAVLGLAKSPWSALKGLVGLPATALRGLTEIPAGVEALTDPATYRGMIPAAKEGITALGNDPQAAGNLLGQLLLGETVGPKIPGAIKAGVDATPGVIAKGVGSAGRGLEAMGTSRPAKMMSWAGAGKMAYGGNPLSGGAMMFAPKAMELAGKGLQALEDPIASLKRAAAVAPDVPKPDTVLSGVTLSPEAVSRNVDATNMRDVEGFSHTQAGKLSGIPGAGEWDVSPVSANHAITDEMIAQKTGRPYVADRPFPSAEPAASPDPAEEVGRSVTPGPASALEGLKTAAGDIPVTHQAPFDLMDEFQQSQSGPVAPGTPWYGDNGEIIGHTTDTNGSTGLKPTDPSSPDFVDEMQRPGGGYDASAELDPAAVERGFQQNNPVFRSMQSQGIFGGDRSAPTLDLLRKAAFDAAFTKYVSKP